MRFLKIATASWVLFIAVLVTAAALSGSFTPGSAQPSSRAPMVTESGEVEMLDGDIRMLERMRVTAHSSMNTMIEADPMWVDPDMIRAQEQYQAQIDRMLARG
ncbi:MAG TPA: hypothetical protein VLA91_05225 [Acidimicrobiia bacterium]|nr:hypothetical protein [Acidimicrobiia bacterium]